MPSHSSFEYLTTQETKKFLRVIDDPRDLSIAVLFLSTGIFLKELIDLKVTDIDWDTRTLKIPGKRPRTIALNDEAYTALAHCYKQRPKTPETHFFLTEKGTVKGLSDRAIDYLLRKYGLEAKLTKKVSSQVLRGGFAVRLFEQGLSLKEAGEILGISDHDSLKRYQLAAHPTEKTEPQTPEETLDQLDTRSRFSRLTAKFLPQEDPPKTLIEPDTIQDTKVDTTVIFGRESLIKEITSLLNKGQPTLLIGPLGIGKTHILKHLAGDEEGVLFFESPTPFKQLLKDICDKLHPNWKDKLGSKASTQDFIELLQNSPMLSPPLLIIDHLDRLKATDAENFVALMQLFTVLGATDNKDSRLKLIWWKFKELEVSPLETEMIKKMIVHYTQHLSINDYKRLENKLIAQANGYPLAIVDMVNQLKQYSRVHDDAIRDLCHDVGTTYRDWSGAFMVFWGALIMCRFVALGTHSFEGYILAGFGTATFGTLRYFLMRRR